MKIGGMGHSHRKLFLQYNTSSERYRIIIEGPDYQVPSELELTMKSNLNHSSITKEYMVGVQNILKYMTNDAFWIELNASYNASQRILSDFMAKYRLMAGGSRKKKSVKKTTKSIY